MTHLDAIALLQSHFPNATYINATNQGNKFEVWVVDDSFENKRLVTRQQAVYAVFGDMIATGQIHALTIHAKTSSEYHA